MSTTHLHLCTPREADAERLRAAAEVVRAIDFLDERPHSIGVTLDAHSSELDVEVHGCSPEELDLVQRRWPESNQHRDADEILRWAEFKSGLVTITFYRR